MPGRSGCSGGGQNYKYPALPQPAVLLFLRGSPDRLALRTSHIRRPHHLIIFHPLQSSIHTSRPTFHLSPTLASLCCAPLRFPYRSPVSLSLSLSCCCLASPDASVASQIQIAPAVQAVREPGKSPASLTLYRNEPVVLLEKRTESRASYSQVEQRPDVSRDHPGNRIELKYVL